MVQAGRRAHEAAAEAAGIIYMTEDRSINMDIGRTVGVSYPVPEPDHDDDTDARLDRGLPGGPANARAVTYAIYGPF